MELIIFIACLLLFLAILFYLNHIGKKYNRIDWDSGFLNVVSGLLRCYILKFHNLKFNGLEGDTTGFKLPTKGGALLISNHLSGIDPFLLIAACDRPIRFMIAKEEYERFYLKWMFKGSGCIPVDRAGRADIAFRQAKRALDSGEIIALFPHGKIHLDHVEPYRVKAGIQRLAELSKTPIYIARLTGVRGQGSVFKPVFLPSYSVVTQFPTIDYSFFQEDNALLRLGELLLGHRQSL